MPSLRALTSSPDGAGRSQSVESNGIQGDRSLPPLRMYSDAVAMFDLWSFLGSLLWDSFLRAGFLVSSGTLENSCTLIALSDLAKSRNPVTSACLNA